MNYLRIMIAFICLITPSAILPDSDPSHKLMDLDMSLAGAYQETVDLINSGANPNFYAKGGDRPIFHAVKSGNKEVVRLLLEKGADPNVSYDDATGSPLDTAAPGGDIEMVMILIKGKAKVNYKMRGALTALHTACLGKESPALIEIITLLLDSGAEVNAVTHVGTTPLMNAVEADNLPAVKLLLERGADPRIKNIQGKTAIDLAVSGGKKPEIIQMLKSWKKKGK